MRLCVTGKADAINAVFGVCKQDLQTKVGKCMVSYSVRGLSSHGVVLQYKRVQYDINEYSKL